MFYCFFLFLLYFFLSTWCYGIAHVSLNCTSVPFLVLYRSINYIPLDPKNPWKNEGLHPQYMGFALKMKEPWVAMVSWARCVSVSFCPWLPPWRLPSTAMEAEWNQRYLRSFEFPSFGRALPLQSWADLPEGHRYGEVMSSWGCLTRWW